MSLDKTTRNCALTLGIHAPNAFAESSAALSTKGCDIMTLGLVPTSHESLAPSGMPETSTSTGALCWASPRVEPEGRNSPIQIMPPENSAIHGAKKQDPFAARMGPIVHDGLLSMASGKYASLGAEGCSCAAPIMRPCGCASLAPTNASNIKGHGIVAPGFSPKGCESLGPSLAPGNSKCTGVKGFSSVPRMTPEGQEFLSLSTALLSISYSGTLMSTFNCNVVKHGQIL